MAPGLSNAQLAKMRADVLARLPDTAVLQAGTLTPDGAGGNSVTWAAVTGGTVACRVDPYMDTTPVMLPGKEATVIEYVATLPYSAPLAANQRVVTGGNTYEIVRLSPDNSWNVSRRAYLVRAE